MNSSLRMACGAATLALLAGYLAAKTGRDAAPDQTLSIKVYDQGEVPAATLNAATAETGRLFRTAGIRISWQHPATEPPQDVGTDMTAAAFRKSDDREYLVIRLILRTPVTIAPGALGYSLPFAHRGAQVVIFYDRVEAATRDWDVPDSVVLGHAMAHELGHVLLGSSEHTNGGLMKERWTAETWRLASAGLITFDHAEIERIRAALPAFQALDLLPAR